MSTSTSLSAPMLPIQPIRAKLSIPRMPLDMVARARLVERLNMGLARQLTLVSAPPGYGKSTVVSEWLKQLQIPSAWLTVDEGDDDLFPFLSYMVAAIRTVYPAFGEQILPLLNARTLPAIQTLVTNFVIDLETLDDGLMLVVDDLYRLTQLPIYEFLERLIAYLPPSVHLVLCTRNDPLLSLVTLRARGQLTEIRQRELRFTAVETRTFVSQASSAEVDEATTSALAERTDGWVVGLRLFLLSAQDEAGLARLAQGAGITDTDVAAYLVEEVMRKQTPLMQEFLLYLAIVERFSSSLCEGLFPRATWQQIEEMLEQMQRQNLFVIALGEGWYRYHPLLREILLHRLTRQVTPAEMSESHRRAASWYEGHGMVSEALNHLLQAPDEALAIQLLARNRMEVMNYEKWQQLEHWLSFFPKRLVDQHPLLAMTQAWIDHAHAQLHKYMEIFPRVESLFAGGHPPIEAELRQMLEGEICALVCQARFTLQGRLAEVITAARRALELLPLSHSMGRANTYVYFVQALYGSGQQAKAQEQLARALEESEGKDDFFAPRIMTLKYIFGYYVMDLTAMMQASTQQLHLAEARALPESISAAHYNLGVSCYFCNDLESAQKYFEQVVAKRLVVHVGVSASAAIFLALIQQASGAAEPALEVLSGALHYTREMGNEQVVASIITARAFLFLLQGRTAEALEWAETHHTQLDLVPRVTSMREAPVVLMKVLVSDNSPASIARASDLLPGMLETARRAHAHFLTAELLALQAKLCLNQRDAAAALESLTKAVLLVARARPVRLFADLGLENSLSLIPLFEELNRRQLAPEYLPQLLEVLAKLKTPRVIDAPQLAYSLSAPEMVEALTPRESEVLELMAKGMSNREIGEQLFLSAKTVENYSLTLYGKLAVKSRGQAVARARELGLIQ